MAISITCPICSSLFKVGSKKCKRCGESLINSRKYKVRIKLPSGRWKTKTVKSLSLAQSIEAKYKDDILRKGELGVTKAPLINEVWESLYAESKQTLKHPDFYEKRWRCHVEPYFSGMKLDRISPAEITKFKQRLERKRVPVNRLNAKKGEKELAASTIASCIKLLGRLFNHAVATGRFDGINPVKRVKLPVVNNAVEHPLTNEEIERLVKTLRAWPNRLAALGLELCLMTGKRTGEVFGLLWTNVDFDKGFMRFSVKSRVRNDYQTLPFTGRAKEILLEAASFRHKGSELVFHTGKGKRIHYRAIWLRIKKEAKLRDEIRPHDLRHTFATKLANSGKVDIYTLQRILGHKTIVMTQRYAHLMDESLQRGLLVAEKEMG